MIGTDERGIFQFSHPLGYVQMVEDLAGVNYTVRTYTEDGQTLVAVDHTGIDFSDAVAAFNAASDKLRSAGKRLARNKRHVFAAAQAADDLEAFFAAS